MTPLTLGLLLFIATYICMIVLPQYRAHIAVGSGLIFIVCGFLSIPQALAAIDFNVLMMIAGTMGTVALFIHSKMPALLADIIIDKAPNVKWVVIFLSLFSGVISAFVDNVATVLMVAPVAISMAKKLKISPVKSVIAISVASNLQGAATLVGDTTSILLGAHAGMNFTDFFFYQGKLGLFFIVQLAMLASSLVLYVIFRKDTQGVHLEEYTQVNDYVPSFLLAGTILSLIIASFIEGTPDLINGYICMGFLLLGILIQGRRYGYDFILRTVKKELDLFTLCLLAGLFVVIGGISQLGVIDVIADAFVHFGGSNVFVLYTILTLVSVLLSAFIDNIPYVATMLPVVAGISHQLGLDPTVLYFGLVSGATLGGNLTPIGASANIASLGILRKEGHQVSGKRFVSISIPYTLAAVLTGYILIWLIYGL